MQNKNSTTPITGYQKFVIFILAITQFTVILDFMVMSPLGDILMKSLGLTPSQFGIAVSAYAFSAGISGLLTAGFADKFDRKKLLLFFYIGFILGTFLCGIVNTYILLVAARIITGLFGGVIGSISMAIVADLFTLQQRGRVVGFLQMGFGASQVLGIPVGLYLADKWHWHTPFWLIGAMAAIIATLIFLRLQPITQHLKVKQERNAFMHLWHTLRERDYRIGFTATALLSIGGFMMMPFGTAFAVNNLKVTHEQLPLIYMVAGVSTLVFMPFIGRLSDKTSKLKIFSIACLWVIAVALTYTQLGPTPLWMVIGFNILMMVGITGRMVPSTALVSGVPNMKDRGAFMSINASLQQIAGGIAAAFAGLIVVQQTQYTPLEHYDTIGYIVSAITLISIWLMYRVNKMVSRRAKQQPALDQNFADVPVQEI
ncbi:MFS transporter [Flavobacterium cyanobacteriorum]|uniref:MFS transporter n=1 Tax=Flavobacterium cyanobacteriorum TaxID=2022802 RepID=A0A255YTC8_9FLAO|nr:MFS transporter [Flavobacterium cyanobacteriorum]OYQ31895.1 MFS transporter [Flavobacterium cyanobacteriorum]